MHLFQKKAKQFVFHKYKYNFLFFGKNSKFLAAARFSHESCYALCCGKLEGRPGENNITHTFSYVLILKSCKDMCHALNQYLNPKKFKHGLFAYFCLFLFAASILLKWTCINPQSHFRRRITLPLFFFTQVYSL